MDESGGLVETVRRWRTPLALAAAVPVLVLASLPVAGLDGPVAPGVLTVWFTVVLLGDVVTAALLAALYRSGAGTRVLVLSAAYVWSASTVVLMMLALPGVLTEGAVLGSSGTAIGWLWLSRHVGPPLLLAAALAPWPEQAPRPRPLLVAGLLTTIAGAAAWPLLELVARPGMLPLVLDPVTHTVVPWALAVATVAAAVSVVVAGLGVLRRGAQSGIEVWAIVAAVAWLGDVLCVMASDHAYSLAWYLARLLGVLAALLVPTSILLGTWRLQQRVTEGAHDLEERIDRLLEAQRVRDHVAAVVSHDLRTPLAGLHGYLEVLVEDDGLTPELVRRMHTRSLLLTKRVTLLAEDLLAAATAEHGGLVLTPVDLDLDEQLRECADGFPELDLRIECPPGATVHADGLRLQQILTNLIRNAERHGAAPVTVTVTPPPPERPDAMVSIRVRDEGDGVPEEFIPRLFERYAQGARADGGTGIGLSVVHDLVQAHGGTTRYDLTDPAFIVQLPAGTRALGRRQLRPVQSSSGVPSAG